MSTSVSKTPNAGGVLVTWLLASPIRSFTSKTTGEERTVVELRDPAALGNSLVLFLDGAPGALADVPTNTLVALRVDSVRSGRGRGELVGTVARADVEAAFLKAGAASDAR